MSPDQIREDIELAVVELVKIKLADGTMTEVRAQQISQLVLDTIKPGMNLEELYKAIFTLDNTATELASIVLPYAQKYEENIAQKASDIVASYIKVGKYDAAIKLTNDVVNENVKLEWQGSGKVE
jgi:hypothetical protein